MLVNPVLINGEVHLTTNWSHHEGNIAGLTLCDEPFLIVEFEIQMAKGCKKCVDVLGEKVKSCVLD